MIDENNLEVQLSPEGDTQTDHTIDIKSEHTMSASEKWRRVRLAVRIVYITITLLAVLFVIVMQLLSMIIGKPSREGIPAAIAFYALNSCQIILCLFIALLEMDFWGWVMGYFKFAKFYFARALMQMYVGVAVYGNSVSYPGYSYQFAQEAAAYVMFGVGVLHLAFGILCLDRLFGLRTTVTKN